MAILTSCDGPSRLVVGMVCAFGTAGAVSPVSAQAPPQSPVATCLADGQVEDALILGDVVYLAGRFEHLRPPGTLPGDPTEVARRWFGACDLDSGAVLPWNPQADCLAPANCTNVRGQSLALAPGGSSLYLGGKFSHVGGLARRHGARVTLIDATVEAWNPSPNDRIQRLLVSPDGARVYVGGNYSAIGGCAPAPCRERLAAVDSITGALIPGFAPAIAADGGGFSTVYSLAFSEDGETLFVGGQFDTVNAIARDSVAAVDSATGAVTTSFAPRLDDPNPADLAVQVHDLLIADGWVYVCGDWWVTAELGGQQDQRNVNRFDPTSGNVDLDFWVATDGGVQACAIEPGLGLLLVGGHFDCVRAWVDSDTPVDPAPAQCGTDALFLGTPQRDLFALDLVDGSLSAWNPDTSGAGGTWALAVAGHRLVAGGDLGWPRTSSPTHQNVLTFDLTLFADGFETGNPSRWSSSNP